jgi:hypothetical protein
MIIRKHVVTWSLPILMFLETFPNSYSQYDGLSVTFQVWELVRAGVCTVGQNRNTTETFELSHLLTEIVYLVDGVESDLTAVNVCIYTIKL